MIGNSRMVWQSLIAAGNGKMTPGLGGVKLTDLLVQSNFRPSTRWVATLDHEVLCSSEVHQLQQENVEWRGIGATHKVISSSLVGQIDE